MSGIYLHIPFCKKACHYCDFHFSTSLANKEGLISALCKEIELRTGEIPIVETLYFGGGTPSLLSKKEIKEILHAVESNFNIGPEIQITLEANPDDLNYQKLSDLKESGINRLSIGVQSFFEEDLRWMNRSHNAKQALQSLQHASEVGFDEINLDLIFGFPLLSDEKWKSNIEQALSLNVQHISSYSMTVEAKTALAHQIKHGQTTGMEEGQAARQYFLLMEHLAQKGWEHYEISNFCLPGYRSKHNISYWQNKNYVGIGPSAHGYIHPKRYWNISNNALYIRDLEQGKLTEDSEILNNLDQFNEFVMTRLRLKEGINKAELISKFGVEFWAKLLEQNASQNKYFDLDEIGLRLNNQGKLLADHLISELFRV